ncbi:MAG: DUF2721 domain-containing protein [Anaerolineales bacterium]
MESEIVWLAPLFILPGIGLLIVSTSNRFGILHDEIHHWLDGSHDSHIVEQADLVERAAHFRNALVALYTSVFVFVCASVAGATMDFLGYKGDIIVFAISLIGIVAVGYASAELIRESLRSLEVIRAHVDHIMDEMADNMQSSRNRKTN